jgi:uncharacterized protein YqeY
MSLQEKITQDMREGIGGTDKEKLGILRFIVGEFSRLSDEELLKYPDKKLPDERVVSIIRKTLKKEQSLASPDARTVELLESYLPATDDVPSVSDAEVLAWIQTNIDLSLYKNVMQAMKPIMLQFAGRATGDKVKQLLQAFASSKQDAGG